MTTMCTLSWISPFKFSVDWSHVRRVAVHPNLVEPGVLHFTSIVSGLILPLPPLLHWCTWLHLVLYFTIFSLSFYQAISTILTSPYTCDLSKLYWLEAHAHHNNYIDHNPFVHSILFVFEIQTFASIWRICLH